MTVSLPSYVEKAIKQLNTAGYEAYVVGGCVRDTLLNREPNDWDITTDALPEQVISAFHHYRVIPTGVQHGTVTVIIDDKPLEITTFRIDGNYSDSRHPDSVSFTRNLHEDLLRRDFTINALAYHPSTGIVDCYSGLADLSDKRIACVGDPKKRFTEDALRILRALRFSAQLGFPIEKMTASAIHQLAPLLRGVSAERIQAELVKLLCGENAKSVLLTFADVIAVILPEIAPMIGLEQINPYHYLSVYEHTVETITAVPPLPYLRLTMLFHDCGKPACYTRDENGVDHFRGHVPVSVSIAEQALVRLCFDRHTVNVVKTLIAHHDDTLTLDDYVLKKTLNELGAAASHDLVTVQKADVIGQHPDKRDRLEQLDAIDKRIGELVDANTCFALSALAVNGTDLREIGFSADHRLGDTLNTLLDLVMAGKLQNDRTALLNKAKEFI